MSTPALVDLVCTLYEDCYGKVGAQILRVCLTKGQLTMTEIVKQTGLASTCVQRTLVSMITNRHILFWVINKRTQYYGNWEQVYRILWFGELLVHVSSGNENSTKIKALSTALINSIVPDKPEFRELINEGWLIPMREWHFWPHNELVASLHSRKQREIANDPSSMGKSENAQRIQVHNETEFELRRLKEKSPPNDAEQFGINWDRFLIQSRRHEFRQFAAHSVGETSAKVYEIVLRLSENRLKTVREIRIPSLDLAVTTQQVVAELNDDLLREMASCFIDSSNDEIKNESVKRLKTGPDMHIKILNAKPAELVNKHLELLVDSKTANFIQRIGNRHGGEWFIAYDKVTMALKQHVFDEIVGQSFGEPASRLIRLIRSKGKLDEKMLSNHALLPAVEIRHQMSVLGSFGFADIQELAKPNDRGGSTGGGNSVGNSQKRSMYLWYHRPNWAYSRMLDQIYMQITRVLHQILQLKNDHRILLIKLSRDDVKSDINTFLTSKELDELATLKQDERSLLKKLNMLDRHVRIFREY